MFEELPEGQTNFDPVAEANARLREDQMLHVKVPKGSQYEWWNCYSPEQLEKRDQAIRQEVVEQVLEEIDQVGIYTIEYEDDGISSMSVDELKDHIKAKFNIKKEE